MPKFPQWAAAKGSRAAAVSNAALARDFYAPLCLILSDLRRRGLSFRDIARELECRGVRTRQGFKRWHATSVKRALVRAAGPFENSTANPCRQLA